MTGKPAARQKDKVGGGVIVQGSLTVLIGSQGGIACSDCPGGVGVGNPVNPLSGAKVLSDEVDFALPGPMALNWSRNYNSYISKDSVDAQGVNSAQVGLLGPGWHLPSSLSIVLDGLHPDSSTTTAPARLLDGKGRVISFDEPLNAGSLLDSPSEGLSLYRPVDMAKLDFTHLDTADVHTSSQIKRHLNWVASANPLWARRSDFILAWSTAGSTVWVFSKATHSKTAAQPTSTAQTLASSWLLIAQVDNFGRALHYQHDRFGLLQGFTDGVGRRYRLRLVDVHGVTASSGFLPYNPDALDDSAQNILKRTPKATPWGMDQGLRLQSVYLTHDPHFTGHASAQQPVELVRYVYSNTAGSQGDLAQVLDTRAQASAASAAIVLRQFSTYSGVMLAHSYAGRHNAPSQYRYENQAQNQSAPLTPPTPGQRVIYQTNEGGEGGSGLSYTFDYHDSQYNEAGGYMGQTTVTDSWAGLRSTAMRAQPACAGSKSRSMRTAAQTSLSTISMAA